MSGKIPQSSANTQVRRSNRNKTVQSPSQATLSSNRSDDRVVQAKRKRTETTPANPTVPYKRRRKSVVFVDLVTSKKSPPDSFIQNLPPDDSRLHVPDPICEQLDIELAIEKFYSALLLEELDSACERVDESTRSTAKTLDSMVIIPETPPKDVSSRSHIPTPRSLFRTPLGEVNVSSSRAAPLHGDGKSRERRLSITLVMEQTSASSSLESVEGSPSRMEVDELEYLFTDSCTEGISDHSLLDSDPQETSMTNVEPSTDSLFSPDNTPSRPLPPSYHSDTPVEQSTTITDPNLGDPPNYDDSEIDLSNLYAGPIPPPNFYDDFDIKDGNFILFAQRNVRFQVWRSELAVYSPLFHYLHHNYWSHIRNNKFTCLDLGLLVDPSSVELVLHLIRNEKTGIAEDINLESEALFHLVHTNKFLLFHCVDRFLDNYFTTKFTFGTQFPAIPATQLLWLGRVYKYEQLVYASIYSLIQDDTFGTTTFSQFTKETPTFAGHSTTEMILSREDILALGKIKDWMRYLWITETTIPVVVQKDAIKFPCRLPRGRHAPKCDDEWARHIKAIHCRNMPEVKGETPQIGVYRQYWTDVYAGFGVLATTEAWSKIRYCEGCIDRKCCYFRECRDGFVEVFRGKVVEFGLLVF